MKVSARQRSTGRTVLVGAAAVTALLLTGCGGDGGGDKVPSAVGGSASGAHTSGGSDGGSGDDVAAYVRSQRAWVACLRKEGVEVPDPGPLGTVDLGDHRGDKKDPAYNRAQEKCRHLSVAMPESVQEKTRPRMSAEQIRTQRRYAECMQKHGAADFPDPGPDGYVSADQEEWDQTSASARRATRTCAPIIGDPVDQPAGKG